MSTEFYIIPEFETMDDATVDEMLYAMKNVLHECKMQIEIAKKRQRTERVSHLIAVGNRLKLAIMQFEFETMRREIKNWNG